MAFTLKAGRPLTLNEDMIDYLCSFVPGNHSVLQVSRLSGIPQSTLITWLDRGKSDQEKDIDSIYSQFSSRFFQCIGKEINSLLTEMHAIGNYNSTSWILEKCYPEDYGHDAPQMKELRDLFKLSQEMRGMDNGISKTKETRTETKET